MSMTKRPKRQRRVPGDVVKIELGDGFHSYARVLEGSFLAFYDYYSREPLAIDQVLQKEILFFLAVFRHAVGSGRWRKVGNRPLGHPLLLPPQFIQDACDPKEFSLYDCLTGKRVPATRIQCEGLERAAVWEPEHVETRLRDYYAGRPNIWVESLKIKE